MAITKFTNAPFSDHNDVALEFAKGFDINKPAIMVVYFHGLNAAGADLKTDIVEKQKLKQGLEASGKNAVIVVPRLSLNKRDVSPGQFQNAGFTKRFVEEAAIKCAAQYEGQNGTTPQLALNAFRSMPVVVATYSGGYEPAAGALNDGMTPDGKNSRLQSAPLKDRMLGIVLMDSNYSSNMNDALKRFMAQPSKPFIVSGHLSYAAGEPNFTRGMNTDLKESAEKMGILAASGKPLDNKKRVSVFEMPSYGAPYETHAALVENNFGRMLAQIPGYRLDAAPLVATNNKSAPAQEASADPTLSVTTAPPARPAAQQTAQPAPAVEPPKAKIEAKVEAPTIAAPAAPALAAAPPDAQHKFVALPPNLARLKRREPSASN